MTRDAGGNLLALSLATAISVAAQCVELFGRACLYSRFWPRDCCGGQRHDHRNVSGRSLPHRAWTRQLGSWRRTL